MANPPATIGEFDNVPQPGSPIRSDWAIEASTAITEIRGLLAGRSGIAFRTGGGVGLTASTWTTVTSCATAGMPAGKYLAFGILTLVSTAGVNGQAKLVTNVGDSTVFEWEVPTSGHSARGRHAATLLHPFTIGAPATVTVNLQANPWVAGASGWNSSCSGFIWLGT